MKVGVGHSDDVDGEVAIAEAIAQAASAIGEAPARGAMLLLSVDYDAATILAAVRARWPGLPIIGCTTDGELSSASGFAEDSVLLVLFAGHDIEVAAGLAEDLSQDPLGAPARAVAAAGLEGATLCLTTPVSNTCDLTAVLRALAAALPDGCPIVGGTAGDHLEFTLIRELYGDRVLQDALPILLFRGPILTSIGVASGWVPVGREYRVTSSTGHRIHELDGGPAVEIYERHWGALPAWRFTEYPLAMYTDDSDTWVLRAVFSGDKEDGSLVCAADVPVGARVRITEVQRVSILDGARESTTTAIQGWNGGDPAAVFVVSCAGRKWLLGTRAAEELSAVQESLGEWGDVPIFGFCSFGEMVRVPGRASQYHNQTCVIAVIGHG